MANNEKPHLDKDKETLRNIDGFYKTLRNKRGYTDKFFDKKHPQSFLSDKNDDTSKDDDTEDFIQGNNSGFYKKDPFIDQTKKYNVKTDKQFIYDYLVDQRGLSKSLVERLIEQDLIRSQNSEKYKYIEFAWKMPNSLEESDGFDLTNQEVVGADRMYFEKDEKGNIKREDNGKQIAKNSSSGYGFNVKTRTGKDVLFVFEAPIDALSYINANGTDLKGVDATFLSLGGVSKSNSIQNFLHKQYAKVTDFKDIVLCVDNDKAGRKMIGEFTSAITDKEDSVVNSEKYRHHTFVKVPNVKKDWNDTLKGMRAFNESPEKAEKKYPNIQYQLHKKTRYDIHDYILQQTKKSVRNITNKSVLLKNIDSLSNMYSKFENKHDINFRSKEYSNYKKTLFAYDDNFKEYMETFGKTMHPKELKKYVSKSFEDHKMTQSEKNNIQTVRNLYKQGNISPAVNMISKLTPNMSLEGLNALSQINSSYSKHNNGQDHSKNLVPGRKADNKKQKELRRKAHEIIGKDSNNDEYKLDNVDLKGSELFVKYKNSYVKIDTNQFIHNLNNNKHDSDYIIKYPDGITKNETPGKTLFNEFKNKNIVSMYKEDRVKMLEGLGKWINEPNQKNENKFKGKKPIKDKQKQIDEKSQHISKALSNVKTSNYDSYNHGNNSNNTNNNKTSFKNKRNENNLSDKVSSLDNIDIEHLSKDQFQHLQNNNFGGNNGIVNNKRTSKKSYDTRGVTGKRKPSFRKQPQNEFK